nr:SNF2 helicase-associated domain-containing protein [Nannocystis pusilla]
MHVLIRASASCPPSRDPLLPRSSCSPGTENCWPWPPASLTAPGSVRRRSAACRSSARSSWSSRPPTGRSLRTSRSAAKSPAPRCGACRRAAARAWDPGASPGALASLLAVAPDTLRGVDERLLAAAWRQVVLAARVELSRTGAPREAFAHAHGVDPEDGRLYLHLAERANDRAHPFAFLVTVARGRGDHGRVLHVPLAAVLTGLAADALARQRLLAPLRRAATLSPFVRALVDSGEVYHPVAWTAAQAHELLLAAPDLEDSGLRLRVPDWWHREPPRPQVRVEVGGARPSELGLDALLDFELRYFLGDDELTPDEWRELVRAPPACITSAAAGSSSTRRATPRLWGTGTASRPSPVAAGSRSSRACVCSPAWTKRSGGLDRRYPWPLARARPRRAAEPRRQPRDRPRPGPARHPSPLSARGVAWLWLLRASASAVASPTTWASARRFR